MAWSQALIELAKKAAQSSPAREGAKKALVKGGEAAAAALSAAGVGAGVKKGLTRKHRKTAMQLARQIEGQYSEKTIVAGRERFVVWKDGVPKDVFPSLDEGEQDGPLDQRWELQNFPESLLKDPPPAQA
jgi:hypothetical protein